jgi:hypothetical protein
LDGGLDFEEQARARHSRGSKAAEVSTMGISEMGNENGNGKVHTDEETSNPFDPRNLRLGQNFADEMGVKKVLLSIPVRKPDRQTFFRTHPDYRVDTAIFISKEDREHYLVAPEMWPELPGDITPVMLFTAITRQGDLFLMPVTLQGNASTWNRWHKSLFGVAEYAERKWIRVGANMMLGQYEIFEATGNLAEPNWPNLAFPKILELAFGDTRIDKEGHPAIRRLRGEE